MAEDPSEWLERWEAYLQPRRGGGRAPTVAARKRRGRRVGMMLDAYASGERDFRKWDLQWSDMAGADLRGINLSHGFLDDALMAGADLRGAILVDTSMERVDLRGADLRGATLRGAFMSVCDLSGADLRDANLDNASLRTVTFRDANLGGSILRSRIYRNTLFTGAKMDGANLRGATVNSWEPFATMNMRGVKVLNSMAQALLRLGYDVYGVERR